MTKSVRLIQSSGLRVRAHVQSGDVCRDQLKLNHNTENDFNWCVVRGFPQNDKCNKYTTELDACHANTH